MVLFSLAFHLACMWARECEVVLIRIMFWRALYLLRAAAFDFCRHVAQRDDASFLAS